MAACRRLARPLSAVPPWAGFSHKNPKPSCRRVLAPMRLRAVQVLKSVLAAQPQVLNTCPLSFSRSRTPRSPNALLRCGWRCGWRLLEVRVVPRQDAIQAVEQMLLLVKAMRLPWINHQFTFHAVALQPAIQLLALAQRIDGIGIALQNERGRLGIFQI